jgi:hypothetical protein
MEQLLVTEEKPVEGWLLVAHAEHELAEQQPAEQKLAEQQPAEQNLAEQQLAD